MRLDYSFLRFELSLVDALSLEDSSGSILHYLDQIRLSPSENYTQISNTKTGISFNGNFTAHLTDCEGVEVLEITDKTQITQITDNNGLAQVVNNI